MVAVQLAMMFLLIWLIVREPLLVEPLHVMLRRQVQHVPGIHFPAMPAAMHKKQGLALTILLTEENVRRIRKVPVPIIRLTADIVMRGKWLAHV